ncbi:MAG: hypothetical protein GX481_07480 [Atopobium sp.]|jgi:phosphate transport system protein|nr:hypothetical protein [Atopobium sp.]
MRNKYNKELTALRQELISIYSAVDLQLHDAVDALVNGDRDKAKQVKKITRAINDRCEKLEDDAFRLVVLQQPVASDLRLIQFIVYASFDLARMSSNVRNIAKAAKRASKVKVPGQLLDLLASMAHLVYRVLGTTAEATVTSDVALATTLPALDNPVDMLNKQFFRTFATLSPGDDLEAATRVVMAARMLERISDNSVDVGSRLVLMLTGRHVHLQELSELDDREIASLYTPRSADLLADIDLDRELAEQIPEVDFARKPDRREVLEELGLESTTAGSVEGDGSVDSENGNDSRSDGEEEGQPGPQPGTHISSDNHGEVNGNHTNDQKKEDRTNE